MDKGDSSTMSSFHVHFKAYFFETPPVTCETMDKTDFEFVLVKSKDLEDILLKQEAFQKYFQEGRNDIAVFDNLGKDAKLVGKDT